MNKEEYMNHLAHKFGVTLLVVGKTYIFDFGHPFEPAVVVKERANKINDSFITLFEIPIHMSQHEVKSYMEKLSSAARLLTEIQMKCGQFPEKNRYQIDG